MQYDFDEFINTGVETNTQKQETKLNNEKVEVVDVKPEPTVVENKPQENNEQKNANNVNNTYNTNNVNNTNNTTNNNKVVAKNASLQLTERMIANVEKLTQSTGEILTANDKAIVNDIMINALQTIRKAGYGLHQIDFIGNNLDNQLKRWAKIGVDTNDFLYCNLRKNGKTGMVDIKIEPQYQTLEKLIIKYCTKNIFRFKTEVICKGDEFETDFDFTTGQDKVLKHKKNEAIDRHDITNIIGAFKVAFVKEKDDSVSQLLVRIDKNRIMRAYNAAPTKNVWNTDTQKMVLKTVTWEMWRSEVIRPFMVFPDYVSENLSVIDECADVDFENKDLKHKNIIDAETSAKESIGTGEGLDF